MTLVTSQRHAVQFFETEDFLAATAAEFLARGVSNGAPAVVIATPARRARIAGELREAAVMVRFVDARETLASMTTGRTPDPRLVTAAFEALDARGGYVFSELAELLWHSDDDGEAALELERMIDEIASAHSISLLCAYPMKSFARPSETGGFTALCEAHGHAQPTESFLHARDQAAEICALQQRSAALSMMSHELRAPLTVILGWAGLLTMGKLDEETAREALAIIERSAKAEAALLDQVERRKSPRTLAATEAPRTECELR